MRTYVLGDQSWRPDGMRSETGLATIELRPVSIPDYLDTTDMFRRVGGNEVVPSPTGRWGERLSLGLTDALASALTRRLPDRVIATSPSARSGRRVFVHLDAIDMDTTGLCRVVASWRVTGAVEVRAGRAILAETASALDDAAMAAVLTRVVGQLADQIAATLDGE
ncbi:conserved hypothetical protein [Candidatus Terasakiella magnetica]|nr:conserved hypothetical protein [Candidatus Terasakiella magnetica]